ncbi:MAG: hypothetical protein ABIF17_03105 [Patescibacteria group bacterium]
MARKSDLPYTTLTKIETNVITTNPQFKRL